jgi:SnoaL-like protein
VAADSELLKKAYQALNARDVDAALATMDPGVIWPNGMEGGYVYGHRGVKDYWLRQWQLIDPRVEPVRFETLQDNSILVEVRQLVRSLAGDILKDQMVHHIYVIEGGRIKRMDIRIP